MEWSLEGLLCAEQVRLSSGLVVTVRIEFRTWLVGVERFGPSAHVVSAHAVVA